MKPLNDDELNFLLQKAKSETPEPNPELTGRAMRAYERKTVEARHWRGILFRPIAIPLPVGVLLAVLLISIGALCEHSFERHSAAVERRSPHAQMTGLFTEFQPVRQIQPRVIRSDRDEQ